MRPCRKLRKNKRKAIDAIDPLLFRLICDRSSRTQKILWPSAESHDRLAIANLAHLVAGSLASPEPPAQLQKAVRHYAGKPRHIPVVSATQSKAAPSRRRLPVMGEAQACGVIPCPPQKPRKLLLSVAGRAVRLWENVTAAVAPQ